MTKIDLSSIELLTPEKIAYWRSKTPAEKVLLCMKAGQVIQGVLRSLLQHAHPEWTDSQVTAEVGRRILLGDEWIENNQDLLTG